MQTFKGTEFEYSTELPPIYAEAKLRFPNANFDTGTIFAYKPYIYVKKGYVETDLLAHELTHFRQQDEVGGPAKWWKIYFADPVRRFEWELEAFQVQYRHVVNNYPKRAHWERLHDMAGWLVRLYELGISIQEAMDIISKPEISTDHIKTRLTLK